MLKSFLNKIIKKDGFLLETSDKKIYTIGQPVKEKPVKLKLHSKSIEYKLALFSDFYFAGAVVCLIAILPCISMKVQHPNS